MESGIFKSGEGTPKVIQQRKQEQEERESLEIMLLNQEYSKDPILNNKIYDLYRKEFSLKSVRNDDADLIPVSQFVKADNSYGSYISLMSTDQQSDSQIGVGRLLQQNAVLGLYEVKTLFEPYPSNGCKNGGQSSNITQTYYQCSLLNQPEASEFRVDLSTYNTLTQNFSDEVNCTISNQTSEICVCPQGYYGPSCRTQLYIKCFVNITDPPFYKSCQKEDSPYYLYSVPGYDPCYFLDFTQVQNIKYILTCKVIDDTGVINTQGENVGYEYRDVVEQPIMPNFTYLIQNPETGFAIMNANQIKSEVLVTLFDWKWLSKLTNFYSEVSDIEVLVGNKEGSISIDFPFVEKQDEEKQSHYIVGGRAYFEAYVVGNSVLTFTTKGFFDKADYVEPEREVTNNLGLILGLTIPLGILTISGIIVFYCCYKKNQKKKAKETHKD